MTRSEHGPGAMCGSQCGLAAWHLAQEYFAGDVNLSELACTPGT